MAALRPSITNESGGAASEIFHYSLFTIHSFKAFHQIPDQQMPTVYQHENENLKRQ